MGVGAAVDDFLLHSSTNSLQLCAFAVLLIFPGSAGLVVIGGAFIADSSLRGRYSWLLPCSVAMLSLGIGLLLVGGAVIGKVCRSHRRERRLMATDGQSASAAASAVAQHPMEEEEEEEQLRSWNYVAQTHSQMQGAVAFV